jgi:hypothetical protein
MNGKINGLLNQAEANENESSVISAEKNFSGGAEAESVYSRLKIKLQNINEWNDHGMLSSYKLFDENGQAQATEILSKKSFIRISLTGSGKYDWVRVTDIYETEKEFIITVQPTFDPTEATPDRSVISHFFTDAARNNFCLAQKNEIVSFYVIGLNEKQNTSETDNALQTVRNVAVNLGSYLGVQTTEWKKFSEGFLECAANEVRQKG